MRTIFISYRREDAEGQAGRLFDDLVRHFGAASVFMDVAGIAAGRDFRRVIDEKVASCGVLLALIGKDWLDAKTNNGERRLGDPADFVRLETASALKRDIPVVPVLVQDAHMPREDQLPADLADLAYRNGVELTHARWDSDVQVLIKAIAPYVDAAPKAADSAVAGMTTPLPATESAAAGTTARGKTAKIAVAASLAAFLLGASYAWFQPAPGRRDPQLLTGHLQAARAARVGDAAAADASARADADKNATANAKVPEEHAGTKKTPPDAERIAPTANARERAAADPADRRRDSERRPATTDACLPGFVWREAVPGDHVCVPPPSRAQAAYDNQLAASRRQAGGGAYGPATCKKGYVWREAFSGDTVCVTPDTRARTAEENALAVARVARAAAKL